MDLIILLVLIIVVCFFFRDYKHAVYFLGIVELFFRLIHFIADHVPVKELSSFINKYIPASLFNVLSKYSSGLLFEILMWLLFACFVSLLVYLVRYFFKK